MKRVLNIVAISIVGVGFVLIAYYYWNKKQTTPATFAENDSAKNVVVNSIDSIKTPGTKKTVADTAALPVEINTRDVPVDSIIHFAETLIGTPYLYASTDPKKGFDCSGFITYVYNHFNIKVPRSSVDFTNAGTAVPLAEAQRGDLILFTGTDSTEKFVGHMGIITSTADSLRFIHSTSGKAYGVTVTPLNEYYMGRFVKVIRMPGKV